MPKVTGFKTGVYRIRNTVNNKSYGGSSAKNGGIKKRWVIHLCLLRQGNHHSKHLQAAWNKYGEDAFVWEVVERCSPQRCLEREQHWMDKEKWADPAFGYNMLSVAGSPLGTKQSPEAIEKSASKRRGQKRSPETCALFSKIRKGKIPWAATNAAAEANRGRKKSQEFCDNLSRQRKGVPLSEDHKANIKANHWSKKPGAEEHQRKMTDAAAESNRGRKRDPEINRKAWEIRKKNAATKLVQQPTTNGEQKSLF